MKTLVAFFEIPVNNFDQSVKFYEAVLSLKLAVMDCGVEKMAFFPEEGGRYAGSISYAKGFNPSKDGVLINLNVESMEIAISAIVENGGKIIIPKTKIEAEGMGYFATFLDCEGNRVGLYADK